MAIQPEQARKAIEQKQAKLYDNSVRAIEAALDKEIQEWDGHTIIKYYVPAHIKLDFYIGQELSNRFYGWDVYIDYGTRWIRLTVKTVAKKRPKYPRYPYDNPKYPWVTESPYKTPYRTGPDWIPPHVSFQLTY